MKHLLGFWLLCFGGCAPAVTGHVDEDFEKVIFYTPPKQGSAVVPNGGLRPRETTTDNDRKKLDALLQQLG